MNFTMDCVLEDINDDLDEEESNEDDEEVRNGFVEDEEPNSIYMTLSPKIKFEKNLSIKKELLDNRLVSRNSSHNEQIKNNLELRASTSFENLLSN